MDTKTIKQIPYQYTQGGKKLYFCYLSRLIKEYYTLTITTLVSAPHKLVLKLIKSIFIFFHKGYLKNNSTTRITDHINVNTLVLSGQVSETEFQPY